MVSEIRVLSSVVMRSTLVWLTDSIGSVLSRPTAYIEGRRLGQRLQRVRSTGDPDFDPATGRKHVGEFPTPARSWRLTGSGRHRRNPRFASRLRRDGGRMFREAFLERLFEQIQRGCELVLNHPPGD